MTAAAASASIIRNATLRICAAGAILDIGPQVDFGASDAT
jgi:hypothetical protein